MEDKGPTCHKGETRNESPKNKMLTQIMGTKAETNKSRARASWGFIMTTRSCTLIDFGQNVITSFVATCDYYSFANTPLDIFIIISYVGHICDYIATSLQLLWFSSFHVNNI